MTNILKRTAALLTFALLASGCGRVEEPPVDSSSLNDITESVSESTADTESTAEDSSDESADDDSSVNTVTIELNTYSEKEAPELLAVINDTLKGAAGDLDDFDEVFDVELLIESMVRATAEGEDKQEEILSSFTEEAKRKTLEQDYEFLHKPLTDNPVEGEAESFTIQAINGTLEDSVVFDLNFDMKCRDGMVTFIGNAYKLNGKWGVMFEPTEYRGEHGGIELIPADENESAAE